MPDYKALYLYLFGKLADMSDEIAKTMQEAENRFLNTEEENTSDKAEVKKVEFPE